jgi:hypothetical protein
LPKLLSYPGANIKEGCGEVVREGGRDYRQKKGIKILNLNSTADTSERGERKKDIKSGERE